MTNSSLKITPTHIVFTPDHTRVVLRKFCPGPDSRIVNVIERIISLSEPAVQSKLDAIMPRFSQRHLDIKKTLLAHYASVAAALNHKGALSANRKLLIGAYFTNEYAYESAALFNPSIVPHPDQTGLADGALRFIMSLRATGEGHISSMTFRTGVINPAGQIAFDPVAPYAAVAPIKQNSKYDKALFHQELAALGFDNDYTQSVLDSLPDFFTLSQLRQALYRFVQREQRFSENDNQAHDKMLWLALANYEVTFSDQRPLSHWVVFPASPSEINGIEDVRFVKFTDDDGRSRYYGTYTAYDGRTIMPQLFETDFKSLKVITLNGAAAQNKGMALFPRKIKGKFAMLSRQDNENISLMYSDQIHSWQKAKRIMGPKYDWEFIQIGNCSPPIETEYGWLVLTHGVGPFREYSIGAVLLDTDDPSKIVGRLKQPIIVPSDSFQGGYVPNVVYTCGCLAHQGKLIIPYALSDLNTTIATVDLKQLLEKLVE